MRSAASGWRSTSRSRLGRATVAEAGELDLLVANAGVSEGHAPRPSWEIDLDEWWHVYEVNVLGVHLCCRAVIPGMLERGRGRIVITGSGAAYLPGGNSTAYPPSKAAVCRYGEMLANELAGRIPVFFFSPGLVRTELTAGAFPTTRHGRRRSSLRSSSAGSPPAATTRSPAVTCTPSTTTSTSCSAGSMRYASATSTRSGSNADRTRSARSAPTCIQPQRQRGQLQGRAYPGETAASRERSSAAMGAT